MLNVNSGSWSALPGGLSMKAVVSESTVRPVGDCFGDVHIANLDDRLRVTEASDGFLAGLGSSSAGVCGRHFGHFVHPSLKPAVLSHLSRVAEGRSERFSTHFRGTGAAFSGGMAGLAVRGTDRNLSKIVLLLDTSLSEPSRVPRPRTAGSALLSETDARVLEGVAAGCSTVQLADRLFLSRQGVDYHVGTLLRRFECPNRPALVAKAFAQGVLQPGTWPPRVTSDVVR